MTKTIIFDLGGVVLNRGIWLFRENLVREYGVSIEDTHKAFLKYYKSYFSGDINEEEFWESFLGDLKIKENWRKFREQLLNNFEPNEGMFKLIDNLRKKGYKVALLSDQTKEWWPFLNKKYKIDSHFDYCLISYKLGINKPDVQVYMTMRGNYKSDPEAYKKSKKYKPDTKIYKLALEKCKSKPEDTIYIDDLKHHLGPPEELGIKTIFYESTEQLKKDLEKLSINL